MKITGVHGRQILDSRGQPTVEVEVMLDVGRVGRFAVPAGASTGRWEARELRDHDLDQYGGMGVIQAVAQVNGEIADGLVGRDPLQQEAIDQYLIDLDGTVDKGRLGANAVLGVSAATAVACAQALDRPLYRYLASLFQTGEDSVPFVLPMPMVNMLSGGLHAGRRLDVQDFLFVPIGAVRYSEAMKKVHAVHWALREVLQEHQLETALVADEGGFGPHLRGDEEGLELLTRAIERAGLIPGVSGAIAIDVAASHFYQNGQYVWIHDGQRLDSDQMVERLCQWASTYPLVSIEDGLAEDDWVGWQRLTDRLGGRLQILGDDLLVTSCDRIRHAIALNAANAALIKMNQIGTLTETLEAAHAARDAGWRIVVSARSGETEDTFMADLAVALGPGQVKVGSITRSERLAKYNQLFRIAEALGDPALAQPFLRV